jgi:hypothetical protein
MLTAMRRASSRVTRTDGLFETAKRLSKGAKNQCDACWPRFFR